MVNLSGSSSMKRADTQKISRMESSQHQSGIKEFESVSTQRVIVYWNSN